MTFLEKTKRFFEPVLEEKSIYIQGVFVAILWGMNGIMHIFFLEKITKSLTHKSESFFWVLSLYTTLIVVFEILNFSVRKWGWVKIEGITSGFASRKVLREFVQIDNNYVESLGTGKMISIIQEGVDKWGLLLWQSIEMISRLIIAIIFVVYMLYLSSIYYVGLFLLFFVFFFFLSRYFNNKLFPYRKLRQINRINISRATIKVLMSKNEILQNNSIENHISDIGELYKNDVRINQDMGTFRVLLVRNSAFGMSIFLLVLYFLLGDQYMNGLIHISTVVGLTGAIIVIQRIITESLLAYIDFTKEFIKVETLWTTFDSAPRLQGYSTGSTFTPENSPIRINSITYGYNDTKVFENFSLTIEKGKKTALVGASGGGKTTLMKLIAGYLHPESGSISVLGNTLSETALKSYYPHIGYLTQDPSVFDATIRENLLSAVNSSDQLSEESYQSGNNKNKKTNKIKHNSDTGSLLPDNSDILTQALRLAQCDFVFELENGLDTEIGERGVRLSGGQKQRLAIAKIFLKNPEIILLDEPTSALDSFSEEKITEALNTLFEGRTVIIIAHRLQTVKHADDIIVIEGGEVVERGNHTELVAKNGIYHKMLELQSGF